MLLCLDTRFSVAISENLSNYYLTFITKISRIKIYDYKGCFTVQFLIIAKEKKNYNL